MTTLCTLCTVIPPECQPLPERARTSRVSWSPQPLRPTSGRRRHRGRPPPPLRTAGRQPLRDAPRPARVGSGAPRWRRASRRCTCGRARRRHGVQICVDVVLPAVRARNCSPGSRPRRRAAAPVRRRCAAAESVPLVPRPDDQVRSHPLRPRPAGPISGPEIPDLAADHSVDVGPAEPGQQGRRGRQHHRVTDGADLRAGRHRWWFRRYHGRRRLPGRAGGGMQSGPGRRAHGSAGPGGCAASESDGCALSRCRSCAWPDLVRGATRGVGQRSWLLSARAAEP